MNQSQRQYLVNRIGSIVATKRRKIAKKFTKKGSVDTEKQKWALVLAGKVKPKRSPDFNRYGSTNFENLYDFSRYEDFVDEKKIDAALVKLEAKATEVKDKAMLGDCEQAVVLLKELEMF